MRTKKLQKLTFLKRMYVLNNSLHIEKKITKSF